MSTFQPTPEQDEAVGRFLSGSDLVVQALAGTGKTSTLKLMAEADPSRRGQYIAFNKSIVEEAGRKMPRNVSARTSHSLAFTAVGKPLAHKLQSKRMPSGQVAALLGIREPVKIQIGQAAKFLAPGWLAGHVMRSIERFCNSADQVPDRRHVPYIEGLDLPDAAGRRTYANHDLIAQAIAPTLPKAWADLINPAGQLRYSHSVYLKLWELSDPVINADYVLFDEAQDVADVQASIVAQQADRCQRVYVGDSNQSIYGWRGAVDALDQLAAQPGVECTTLSQSFRFGPAIADMANACLDLIPTADLRVTGYDQVDSVVTTVDNPDAFLCRTNARAMRAFLDCIATDRKAHLIGGGKELASFARAWIELRDKGWTAHPELSCFDTPAQVEDYVDADPQGSELALLVQLVTEHTPETLLEALDNQVPEHAADEVISTSHKSKGREWASVALAERLPGPRRARRLRRRDAASVRQRHTGTGGPGRVGGPPAAQAARKPGDGNLDPNRGPLTLYRPGVGGPPPPPLGPLLTVVVPERSSGCAAPAPSQPPAW